MWPLKIYTLVSDFTQWTLILNTSFKRAHQIRNPLRLITEEENRPSILTLLYEESQMTHMSKVEVKVSIFDILYSKFKKAYACKLPVFCSLTEYEFLLIFLHCTGLDSVQTVSQEKSHNTVWAVIISETVPTQCQLFLKLITL